MDMCLGKSEIFEVWFFPRQDKLYAPSCLGRATTLENAHLLAADCDSYDGNIEIIRQTVTRQLVGYERIPE